MTYDTEHQAALKTVTETNERLAQKMHWPLWRHAAVGALFCVLLLGISLPGSIGGVINVAMIGVVFLLIRDDKRRHGMWVSGYQKGRTGWVMAALVGLVLACIAASMAWIDEQPLGDPLFWSLQAVLFFGATGLSILWQRVYRADIKAGRT